MLHNFKFILLVTGLILMQAAYILLFFPIVLYIVYIINIIVISMLYKCFHIL